eukprot:sb/3471300/
MVRSTFYKVPKHISRSNLKFQTQLPTADPTISLSLSFLSHKPFSMKSLDKKIKALEKLIANPERLNNAIYNLLEANDLNNDHQISRAEFQKVLQDYGIGDFDAVDDLFESLDSNNNGYICYNEFRPFFRAHTKIKLKHLKEIRDIQNKANEQQAAATAAAAETSSDSSPEPQKKSTIFGRWKSTRN